MPMPKADSAARQFLDTLLPDDPRITVRPMFGNVAAFVNGNMFAGVFGAALFVRLPETEREELLSVPGAAEFAPMPGRPMQEYATLPESWRGEPETARAWLLRSLEWAAALPPKEKKPPKKRGA
jgi:TfoX/Sxy family transcriptional regulator of competence genes